MLETSLPHFESNLSGSTSLFNVSFLERVELREFIPEQFFVAISAFLENINSVNASLDRSGIEPVTRPIRRCPFTKGFLERQGPYRLACTAIVDRQC